jgi:hypothetical protein
MKKLVAAMFVLSAQLAWAPAASAEEKEAKPAAPQQQRMRDCNAEAKGMQGQERKDFMKQCLSGKQAERKAEREERKKERQENREARQEERKKKQPSEAQLAQREKMKTCNADAKAKGLKGDARKAFMSDCLKN